MLGSDLSHAVNVLFVYAGESINHQSQNNRSSEAEASQDQSHVNTPKHQALTSPPAKTSSVVPMPH